jgi:hypothetical protein
LSRNKRFSYLAGIRNRSNKSLLRSQETQGHYVPASSDFQALLTYQFSSRSSIELFGNIPNQVFASAFIQPAIPQQFFLHISSANLGIDIFL